MKNIKNTVAAMTMMVVMGLSATFANAGGLLVSDRGINTGNTPEPCTVKNEGPDNGIMISDIAGGIIIYGLSGGIIIYGRNTNDTCKN